MFYMPWSSVAGWVNKTNLWFMFLASRPCLMLNWVESLGQIREEQLINLHKRVYVLWLVINRTHLLWES